jgi:signal transduction histidine kinase
VEMHGGLLQFQTRASHGTTFQIVLPKDSNHAGKNSVD